MDTVIQEKKKIKGKHIQIIGVVAIVIAGISYLMLSVSGSSKIIIDKNKLQISEVKQEKFHDYINSKGKVQPKQTIYLDAVEGGRVKEIVAEEGSKVMKGEVIIELENNELYQQILNSEVALAEKENYLRNTRISFRNDMIQSKKNMLDSDYQLKRAKRNYEQQHRLLIKGLVPEEDFIKAKEDYEYQESMLEINWLKLKNDSLLQVTTMQTLEEDLIKMRETLKLVRSRLDHLKVKATTNAHLGTLNAEIGQSIQQGQHLGILYDLSDAKIIADIDERYISKVKKGLKAVFQYQNQNYSLIIDRVYPEVKDAVFKVELQFENEKPKALRTGQTTYVKINLDDPVDALTIKKGNFYSETAGRWVYVVSEDGTYAEKREIRIGAQNASKYQITKGLKAGEKVIISKYEQLGGYDKVVFE
ncbi:HlyD family efflux transporter periplasmic adaptor subunit [Flammeovirga yaeyamensis]|uniref:HlyD family efflux transporter periplasmic adaptor subunit n=1 Tax=Flammeovirga yaeyamensis TaxID=367791 RepID=A0AAX1N377_9BACT|nr:HlyD family efflux transporter periplasmic adaptor subunit [Flammeovirga yaeyamensis]MBB3700613.1 HlyD family secretion protein [Flammeovirga yaeyamensis]NMF37729.1 HlyD family efflux transporter periplasmic adaptor subunit [Flammeovirga yaeyamensis]QWG02038.1 HlyD family efflux transporter periplasmic adaptor subunit [Flammeovirga yaeyamensis]